MNKSFALIILIAVMTSCSWEKNRVFIKSFSHTIHKEKLVYNNGGKGLYYYKPCSKDTISPMLFIIGGSGHSSAVYTLANYSNALKNINAEVYMLQKRHVRNRETGFGKASKAFIRDYNFSQMLADQQYFITMILGSEENKNRKVCLLGVSEGATIAAKIASDIPRIQFLAIIGSGGIKQSEEFNILYPEQKQNLDLLYKSVRNSPQSLDSVAMGYTYKYWSDILFRDPMDYFMQLDIPIIVANGEKDQNSPAESARYLKSTFEDHHKPNLTYIEYKNCNHTLRNSNGKSYLPDFFAKINTMIREKK